MTPEPVRAALCAEAFINQVDLRQGSIIETRSL